MVDVDAVIMYPNIADSLLAYTVIAGADGEPQVDGPAPFLRAAADAMDIDPLRVIDTGLDPVTAEREQWDDGNNTLAIAPRLCVGVRAQRGDQRPARAGRHRGDPDPRLRAGLRPRRPALHVLPDAPETSYPSSGLISRSGNR